MRKSISLVVCTYEIKTKAAVLVMWIFTAIETISYVDWFPGYLTALIQLQRLHSI
jgi:hypothetical protein